MWKRSAVWTQSGSRYATVLLTSRHSVVCTPYSFFYATLREPDSVHTAQRFDVDRTVAYGKAHGLHTTLRLDAYRTVG